MFERVLFGGRVAIGDEWQTTDVAIEDGRIVAIGRGLRGADMIDASGRWVLPGGIDAHCHIDQPAWNGVSTKDDFRSATLSAAYGGTTTVVPFAMPSSAMTTIEAVERSLACADGCAFVDYGLHGVITPATLANTPNLFSALIEQGVSSVKVYTTYEGFAVDDSQLLAILDGARAHGHIVLVHAENDASIRRTRDRLIVLGRVGIRYHAVAHSKIAEREAVHRVIALCEIAGARVVIMHVTSAEATEAIVRARAGGVHVFGETCPQYLVLTASDLDGPIEHAIRFVFSPPPRGVADQNCLWQSLLNGELAIVSSDHAPYSLEDKLLADPNPAFYNIANGIPGLETRLPILISDGLIAGRLSLARYLDLAGRTAAELYGLDHRKGRIELGFDADLAIWNPAAAGPIRSADLHSAVGYTPFEGRIVAARPETVLVRGTCIIRSGRCVVDPGIGRYVARRACEASSYSRPAEDATPWLNG